MSKGKLELVFPKAIGDDGIEREIRIPLNVTAKQFTEQFWRKFLEGYADALAERSAVKAAIRKRKAVKK